MDNLIVVYRMAEWEFGLIEGRYRSNRQFLAELRAAYNRAIIRLRGGEPDPLLWKVQSSQHPNAFEICEGSLRFHFRRIHDNKIGVVDIEEFEPPKG